jgi:hypothetical protein
MPFETKCHAMAAKPETMARARSTSLLDGWDLVHAVIGGRRTTAPSLAAAHSLALPCSSASMALSSRTYIGVAPHLVVLYSHLHCCFSPKEILLIRTFFQIWKMHAWLARMISREGCGTCVRRFVAGLSHGGCTLINACILLRRRRRPWWTYIFHPQWHCK